MIPEAWGLQHGWRVLSPALPRLKFDAVEPVGLPAWFWAFPIKLKSISDVDAFPVIIEVEKPIFLVPWWERCEPQPLVALCLTPPFKGLWLK